jgi:hypothetical protein
MEKKNTKCTLSLDYMIKYEKYWSHNYSKLLKARTLPKLKENLSKIAFKWGNDDTIHKK